MTYINNIKNKWNHNQLENDLKPQLGEGVELRLELSNICNHACLFCPHRKMKRERREMDEVLVKNLMQQGSEVGIKKIGLFIYGEPFASKQLPEYIAFAKLLGYEYVYITTNGALATEERLKAVIDAGVDSIKFSINGGSRESYQLVHQRDDYDKVLKHLKYAYNYRRENGNQFKILSSCVVTKYMGSEIEKHQQNIQPYVDELVFLELKTLLD